MRIEQSMNGKLWYVVDSNGLIVKVYQSKEKASEYLLKYGKGE